MFRGLIYTSIMVLIWTYIMTLSHDHYILGKVNRYRFRFWFTIAGLNVMHLLLAGYYMMTGDSTLQDVRWYSFIVIDALMFESFINYTVGGRKAELFFRLTFYISLAVANAFSETVPFITLIYCGILISVAFTSTDNDNRLSFGVSMIMYTAAMVVPHVFGHTGPISMFFGLLYTLTIAYAINRLYKNDLRHEATQLMQAKWK